MSSIQGPAISLAPYVSDEAPFDSLDSLGDWAAANGHKAVEIPSWDARLFDLETAAASRIYCDDVKGRLAAKGLAVAGLSSERQGRLVAAHPAYDEVLDAWAPPAVRVSGSGNREARQEWATNQLRLAARASHNLGLSHHVTRSGTLLWPFLSPALPRPAGLLETGFAELARRFRPVLDAFDQVGVDLCFVPEAGEDMHDGITFERLFDAVGGHPRCRLAYDPAELLLQQIDYLEFIEFYGSLIKAFYVSDAEVRPSGRQGPAGSYEPPRRRAARHRSPGDGEIDFAGVFTRLGAAGFGGWAVLRWACCFKHPLVGAREGAEIIQMHLTLPPPAERPEAPDDARNRRILGLP